MKICDKCNGERDKKAGFKYLMWSGKLPKWSCFVVKWEEYDLCFSCLKECFNEEFIKSINVEDPK